MLIMRLVYATVIIAIIMALSLFALPTKASGLMGFIEKLQGEIDKTLFEKCGISPNAKVVGEESPIVYPNGTVDITLILNDGSRLLIRAFLKGSDIPIKGLVITCNGRSYEIPGAQNKGEALKIFSTSFDDYHVIALYKGQEPTQSGSGNKLTLYGSDIKYLIVVPEKTALAMGFKYAHCNSDRMTRGYRVMVLNHVLFYIYEDGGKYTCFIVDYGILSLASYFLMAIAIITIVFSAIVIALSLIRRG